MDRSKANPESRSTGRLRLCLFLLVIAGIPSCLIAQSNTGATAQLNINVTRIVSPVSPTLYGLMTEEINHSYDGGLYAEMIQNRAFHDDWEGEPPWDLVRRGNAAASQVARQVHRAQRGPALQHEADRDRRPPPATRPG